MNENTANAMTILTGSHTLTGETIPTVNARDLHTGLGLTSRFRDWMPRTIEALGLVENVDYVRPEFRADSRVIAGAGRRAKEYHLTLSAAQRIAVSGNTEIGKALWSYLKATEEIAHRRAADEAKAEAKRMVARITGKAVNLEVSDALKAYRAHEGKKAAAHVYSNEATMIDTIALGMTPKAWKAERGLPAAAPVRDHMTAEQLELVAFLEQADRGYMGMAINSGLFIDYRHRKMSLQVLREAVALRWPVGV